MDAIIKQIERLADMASRQTDPLPLDSTGVMARIRGIEFDDGREVIPLGFLTGGAAAAAAAAAFISVLAVSAWSELSEPLLTIDSLVNVMDVII